MLLKQPGPTARQQIADGFRLGLFGGEKEKVEPLSMKLIDFVVRAWNEVLHPSEHLEIEGAWYIELFCEWLTVVSVVTALSTENNEVAAALLKPFGLTPETFPEDLRDVKNLLFNISPRCSKSTVITVCWPAWEWLFMPWLTYMAMSYAQPLATDHNDDRRTIIKSDWYQELSGGMRLSDSKNRTTEFRNDAMGEMKGRGLDATVMGGGGLRLIFDDPNDTNKADSEQLRAKAKKSFRNYSRSRKNDPKRSAVVVVQQRTHEADVSGDIRANNPDFRQVIIPMEAEIEEEIVFPLSGRIVIRSPGDLMHEDRFDAAVINALKRDPQVWASQYQQRPSPSDGGLFKLRNWRLSAVTPRCDRSVLSADATFTDSASSDYFVVGPIGQIRAVRWVDAPGPIDPKTGKQTIVKIPQHQYWVPERWRGQAGITEGQRQIKLMAQRYPEAYPRIVEKAANGFAIAEQLSREMPGIEAVPPGAKSKVGRAAPVVLIQERGDIILPLGEQYCSVLLAKGKDNITIGEWWDMHPPPQETPEHAPVAPWVKDFLEELTLFDNGKHDDQVDFLTQGVNYMESNAISTTSATPPALARAMTPGRAAARRRR
jgi:phage terminase large subunit-like protein